MGVVGTGVGTVVGEAIGVPVAPGTGLMLMVICAASGKVLPLEMSIVTLLTPGCCMRYCRAFCLLILAI